MQRSACIAADSHIYGFAAVLLHVVHHNGGVVGTAEVSLCPDGFKPRNRTGRLPDSRAGFRAAAGGRKLAIVRISVFYSIRGRGAVEYFKYSLWR